MLRCARPCRDYCTHERALLLTVSCLAATISPKREQCSQTREGEAHVAARDRRSRPGRLHHRDAAGRAGRAGPPRQSTGQRPDASRDRAGGRRRDRRRAAQRPGRWRRRALQLRQPALPPLAHRLAAAGLLAADRGRAERSGAGVREQRITRYQWNRPFVIDSTFTERTFGLAPIELDTALASVAARATQRAAT